MQLLRSNWFIGLVISLLFLVADQSTLIQSLERSAYDWGVRASVRPIDDRIAIIAIDDQSIANLGRWPWPRSLHARMINYLTRGQPKLIVNSVLFLEPQRDPGLNHLDRARNFLNGSGLKKRLKTLLETDTQKNQTLSELQTLERILSDGINELNIDQHLAAALVRAGNVILAMPFTPGIHPGKANTTLPDYLKNRAIPTPVQPLEEHIKPFQNRAATPPIPLLGQRAMAIGNINDDLDVDGAVRTTPLILDYHGMFYPSLALITAVKSLNLKETDIEIHESGEVRLGNLSIQTDDNMRMHTFFYQDKNNQPAFRVDSFFDTISEKIPPEKYHNKIVLIGPTATGVGHTFPTPISSAMSPVHILAHTIASLLNEDYFSTPSWSLPLKWILYLTIALYLILSLPRLNAAMAAGVTTVLATVLLLLHYRLMTAHATWIQLMGPLTLLLTGYLILTSRRFFLTEKDKILTDAESVESNRMLGLAFQGQGQLDMAFDKFRKCPLDDNMMDVFYNLGLDFDRKRQFGKALTVYQHMAQWDPDYRNIKNRINRSSSLEQTVVLGGGSQNDGLSETLISTDGTIEKPMLGRYQVEKELGKGAMGTVYQGRDPNINRIVAIKTLSLGDAFEGKNLELAKKRFFQEAESAGRLNHPTIVTIFDTGQDNGLAYIAMEYLQGHDLDRYAKGRPFLPVPLVIQIIAKVAIALDYAHKNSVVHRDIKPSNIMFNPKTKEIKVTDFGIARLTEGGGTKTRTGLVLGTPYYMSPEQIAGHRVDGRSDLFSLGVTFFQLLTGQLPFSAQDMATLLFQITTEPHKNPRTLRNDLPECLEKIIDTVLQKQPEKRFQSGALMARALILCVKNQVKKPTPNKPSPN